MPVPLEDVKHLLPVDLVTLFEAKAIEWETDDRTYCSQHNCSTFIQPTYIAEGVATCLSCGNRTCTKCKAVAHDDDECPEDSAFKALSELARGEEWQRCYKCRSLVSISTGCNHMTQVSPSCCAGWERLLIGRSCLCTAEFCYECGERWKTCRCDQWRED